MNSFQESGLSPELLKAIEDLGFETPTEIQAKSIPHLLSSKKDLVGLAQTGTGKTAAFSLPIIEQVDPKVRKIQALILCPTRELCLQIQRDVESFSKYIKGFQAVAVYGGAAISNQIKAIKKGPAMVVGTPGRVLDLIRRKVLDFSAIEYLVLDEADEMLSMGFKEELDGILSTTSETKQTLLFSATMAGEVARIAKEYMSDPEEISAGTKNQAAANVEHLYVVVQARDRYKALRRVCDVNPDIYGIVFCRTRRETKEVADRLGQDGYNADALHGDLSQAQRDHVMKRFRDGQISILVATDVAARGIDVNSISHVLNYNLPQETEVYIHRSGRTGRAGKKGICLSILHSREGYKVRNLEKLTGKQFTRMRVPTGEEICRRQLFSLINKVQTVEVNEENINPFLNEVSDKLANLSREELIQRFLSVEFNRFLEVYGKARDLNIPDKGRNKREVSHRERKPEMRGVRKHSSSQERSHSAPKTERKGREDRGREERGAKGKTQKGSYAAYRLNLGAKHGMNPSRLIGLINEVSLDDRVSVGRIDVKKNFSVFEVDAKFAEDLKIGFEFSDFEGLVAEIKPASQHQLPSNFNKKSKKGKKGKKKGSFGKDRKKRRG